MQTNFDAPAGTDPVALDLSTMGKGQAWVNGHHLGRYWTLVAPKDGCEKCDYRGAYGSDKCMTNCGKPTQVWYNYYAELLLSNSIFFPAINFWTYPCDLACFSIPCNNLCLDNVKSKC